MFFSLCRIEDEEEGKINPGDFLRVGLPDFNLKNKFNT